MHFRFASVYLRAYNARLNHPKTEGCDGQNVVGILALQMWDPCKSCSRGRFQFTQ